MADGVQRLAYSVSETAEMIGVSPWLVRERVRDGSLASIRFGTRIVIPAWAVEQIVGNRPASEIGNRVDQSEGV